MSVTFNNGNTAPNTGFGTWGLSKDEVFDAVVFAIKSGYRHIDGAMIYENEAEVGKAINHCIDTGVCTRKDLFVVSKLWNHCHRPENVPLGLEKTLSDLQLDYLDLYLIHWPVAIKFEGIDVLQSTYDGDNRFDDEADPLTCWHAMEKLFEQGKVKNIGVSNFDLDQIKTIVDNCKIKPVTNQFESHPCCPSDPIRDFCIGNNIIPTAYSPLGNPGRVSIGLFVEGQVNILETPEVIEAAKSRGCEPANVVLQWGKQRNCIVIPKSVTPSRIVGNLKSISDLSPSEMDSISKYGIGGKKYITVNSWANSKHFPKVGYC